MRKLCVFFSLATILLKAQVPMNVTGSYNQDFNNLLSTNPASNVYNPWIDDSTIESWYIQQEGTISSYTYRAGTGSSTTGAIYSFGNTSDSDRSLGSLNSSTTKTIAYGVLLRNVSGTEINDISVSYTGKQWRCGGETIPQVLTFSYKTSDTIFNSLSPKDSSVNGWIEVPILSFNSIVNSSTTGLLNGNLPDNQKQFSKTSIPNLSIANGDCIMLRWRDINHTGNDHALSIDNVTISWVTQLTGVNSKSNNTNIVYPNPVKDFIYFSVNISDCIVELYDLTGKLIQKKLLNGKRLDISGLHKGVYILHVIKGNEYVLNQKILKE